MTQALEQSPDARSPDGGKLHNLLEGGTWLNCEWVPVVGNFPLGVG